MNEIELIIKQFILEGGKLYTLPELYHQLEEKIHSNTASINEISDILSTDTALSAKILKIANSALYGFRSEITTLNRALNLIGLKEVKNLILMDAIANKFCDAKDCLAIKMEHFWRRSVYFALISKRLSIKVKHPEPDRLFVSAIMSRLGQLVCCSTRPDEVSLILSEHLSAPEKSEFEVEQRCLGFTYNEVSAALLEAWRVPDEIVSSIRYLHDPLNTDSNPYQEDSFILNVASIYSSILEIDELCLNEDESDDPLLVEPSQTCLDSVNPEINQSIKINKTMVENILFEIEMDALQILQIIFPKSSLIF